MKLKNPVSMKSPSTTEFTVMVSHSCANDKCAYEFGSKVLATATMSDGSGPVFSHSSKVGLSMDVRYADVIALSIQQDWPLWTVYAGQESNAAV
jgi:hypothetical protein